jgi:ENTS family enterobactin (siderophore) exporter
MTTRDPTTRSSLERRQAEQALLEPPVPHTGGLPLGLFTNRPFGWLVVSMGVSQLGFWAFFVAVMGAASFRYHAGPFELGILFSSFSVSFLILTAPFGMLTDRWSPKWLVVLAQIVGVAAVVPALTGGSMAWLYLASVIDGIGAAIAIPARGSLTALLVDEDSLVKANGMLNTASMLAVIIGPGLAGLIVATGGQDAVFWFIAATLVVGGLLLLPIPDRRPRPGEQQSFLSDLVDGFRLAWRQPELRILLFLAGAAWFLLTVLVTLEPLFVKDVLHRGVGTLGFLWSAHGVGAFLGALAVAGSKRASRREILWIAVGLVVSGLGYLGYVATAVLPVAVLGTAVLGVGFAWYLSLSQALIQRVTPEELRGRVTGVVGILQEGASMASAVGIAALGGVILVQPALVVAAAGYVVTGVLGLRSARRLGQSFSATEAAPARSPAAAPGPTA